MSELAGKLSTYNIFNYLLTGVLFVAVSQKFTPYAFVQENLFLAPFVYYFIGLVLSRFGSLIVEPVLKKIKYIKFKDYPDFINAFKKDPQIEVLSETNNMYRTFLSVFIVLVILKLYAFVSSLYPSLANFKSIILLVVFLLIFLLAYRKQTTYITMRIDKINSN
jgi:hypothetical protein